MKITTIRLSLSLFCLLSAGTSAQDIIPQSLTKPCGGEVNNGANKDNRVWVTANKPENRLTNGTYVHNDSRKYGVRFPYKVDPKLKSRNDKKKPGWGTKRYREAVARESVRFRPGKKLCDFTDAEIDEFVNHLKNLAKPGTDGHSEKDVDDAIDDLIIEDYLRGVETVIENETGKAPEFPLPKNSSGAGGSYGDTYR